MRSRNQSRQSSLLCINESDLRIIANLIRFSLSENVNLFENQSKETSNISDIIDIINNPTSDSGSAILAFAKDRMLSDGKTNIPTSRALAELDENQFNKFTSALRDAFEDKFKEFSKQKGRTQEKKVDELNTLYMNIKRSLEIVDSIKFDSRRVKPSENLGSNIQPGKKSKPVQDVTAAAKKIKLLKSPEINDKFFEISSKIQKITHPKLKYYRQDIEEQVRNFISDLDPEEDIKNYIPKLNDIEKYVDKQLIQQKKHEKDSTSKKSEITHDPFSSEKKSTGLIGSLKNMFSKIRSENFDLDCEVITEEIINLMMLDGHLSSRTLEVRARRIIREMLEQHDQMGPSETGVFDAPHEEHPGYMLLGNLKKLASKSSDLAKLASPWDDAEPWIESKINSAAEHIDAVHDYIMYSVLKKDFDASEHEDMMYECGEMPGDLMMEPMETHGHMGADMIGGRHFGDGGSAQMARGQLFQIAKKSQSLSDRLVDDDTLPEWMQSKVAMAYQSISAIYDYLDYKMMRQDSGDPVLETRKRRRSR